MRQSIFAAVFIATLTSSSLSLAQNTPRLLDPENSILIAQSDDDDAYDPFADYSEFEESMEEEEDLNFFRNGRLLTLGFTAGLRGFTGNLSKIYQNNGIYGLNLTFFFDLNFGMQLGFLTGQHTVAINANPPAADITGSVSLTDISLNLKYYFNTQNVTKGLANLNPYLLGGVSQVQRTVSLKNTSVYTKDSAFGFNLGAGIEIPMMRNKMFFGIQGAYQVLNFSDENRPIPDSTGQPTIKPSGDSWTGLGMLGLNF